MFITPWPMFTTIAILLITVILFTSGKFRSDIVALCALLSLMICGVLTPQDAFTGFSNPIIPTIAAVFIVGGAIVRSGLSNAVSERIINVVGTNQTALFMSLMLLTALVGSLVSNTGTVAIMMPIVGSMAVSLNVDSSRFLMPLAFMSSIGGMLTLIGNPGNMVVNDVYIKAGYESLTLFSFLPIGLVSLAFGMLVLAPITAFYLSRRKNVKTDVKSEGLSLDDLADKYSLSQHLFHIIVSKDSPIVGQTLAGLDLTGKYGVFIQEIRRQANHRASAQTIQIDPGPKIKIEAGDSLYALASEEKAKAMADNNGLKMTKMNSNENSQEKQEKLVFDSIGICEIVLMSSSHMVNQTIADSGFRELFGLSVLAIQRGDRYILENLKDQVMQSGDALLVQGSWDNIGRLDSHSSHWVVVGRPWDQAGSSGFKSKIPYVGAVLFLMILSMATGLLPTVLAALLAALALGIGGCFKNVEDAYSSINWETLIMIACMLPMALAMEKTGIVAILSDYMTEFGLNKGPWAALAMVYALASFLNIIISATPVALLVAPVAIKVAVDLGASPLPFVFAVAVSSCMCFASPFSTPSNALVMSAGRYTFFDYLKIGLPLQILMGIVMVLVLPLLFPF